MDMTAEQKHKLLLRGCRVVRQITHRIENMAYSMATIYRDSPAEGFDTPLDIVGQYVIGLIDSEDGLEPPENHEEWSDLHLAMTEWLQSRGVIPPATTN